MLFEKVENNNIVFVYTTCADTEEARQIGYEAIESKLAISADYWIIDSIYPWKNVIQEINQCMLVFLTQKSISDKLMKFIEAVHSYNIPMIIRSDSLITNTDYSFWAEKILSSKDKYISEEEYQIKNKTEKQDSQYDKLK